MHFFHWQEISAITNKFVPSANIIGKYYRCGMLAHWTQIIDKNEKKMGQRFNLEEHLMKLSYIVTISHYMLHIKSALTNQLSALHLTP